MTDPRRQRTIAVRLELALDALDEIIRDFDHIQVHCANNIAPEATSLARTITAVAKARTALRNLQGQHASRLKAEQDSTPDWRIHLNPN
jgi:hypothetical protein